MDGGQMSLLNLRSEEKKLPGSAVEIASISKQFNGDYIFGNQASEKLFKELSPNYQILHLAIHGETNDSIPEYSNLSFYAKGDTIEDGQLYAFELYNLDLNADLAVLSACNTGSGKIVNGEGVMSLGRAFAHAGVRSLLLTRDEVSDATSPRIIQLFYEELKKGKRKSDALRSAKLRFLKEANNITSDPFYWSSYYTLGDDSSIEFQRDRTNRTIVIIGSTLITPLIVVFLWRKKQRNASSASI